MIFDTLSCFHAVLKIPNTIKKLLAHEWAFLLLPMFEKQYSDNRPRKCLDLVLSNIVGHSVTREQFRNTALAVYESAAVACVAPKIESAAAFAAAHICAASAESKYKLTNATCRAAYELIHTNKFSWQFIEDTFNQCWCPDLVFDDNWKTSTVVELAKTIFMNNALDHCPILADALEDAGCTEEKVLEHLRSSNSLRSDWLFWNLLGLGK
jgi:hypothetical protein